MSERKKKLDAKVERFGEVLVFNGSVSVRAIVQDFAGSLFSTYLTYDEQSLMPRPGLVALISADQAISPGDTTQRDGRQFSVLKSITERIGGEAISKFVILV